jgi:hypothetical protein
MQGQPSRVLWVVDKAEKISPAFQAILEEIFSGKVTPLVMECVHHYAVMRAVTANRDFRFDAVVFDHACLHDVEAVNTAASMTGLVLVVRRERNFHRFERFEVDGAGRLFVTPFHG